MYLLAAIFERGWCIEIKCSRIPFFGLYWRHSWPLPAVCHLCKYLVLVSLRLYLVPRAAVLGFAPAHNSTSVRKTVRSNNEILFEYGLFEPRELAFNGSCVVNSERLISWSDRNVPRVVSFIDARRSRLCGSETQFTYRYVTNVGAVLLYQIVVAVPIVRLGINGSPNGWKNQLDDCPWHW